MTPNDKPNSPRTQPTTPEQGLPSFPGQSPIHDPLSGGLVGRIPELESIESELKEAELQISMIQAQQSNATVGIMNEASAQLDQYQDQIMGGFERQLDSADQVLDKIDSKIQSRIAETLGEAYAYAQQLGYRVPGEGELEGWEPGTVLPMDIPPLTTELQLYGASEGQTQPSYTGEIPNVIQPTQQPTESGCSEGSVEERRRPGLSADHTLPYWVCNGKYYISATMPCGVPVPPAQGWVPAPWNGMAVFVFDSEQDAIDACKPMGGAAQDVPPPPPPAPLQPNAECEAKPYCPPCDIDYYYKEWDYGRMLTTEIPQNRIDRYICAVRVLAAWRCAEHSVREISQAEYHQIRQQILDGHDPLEPFGQWREAMHQLRGTEAWKLSFLKRLDCRATLTDGTVVSHSAQCGLSGEQCAIILGQALPSDYPGGKPPSQQDCNPADLIKLPKWGSLDACKEIDSTFACFKEIQGPVSRVLGFWKEEGSSTWIVPPWWGAIVGKLPGWLDTIITGITVGTMDGLQSLIMALPQTEYCDVQKMVAPAIVNFLLGIGDKLSGGSLDDLRQGQRYTLNYACPTYIPTGPDVLNLWRKGVIGEELAKCWLQANNLHFKPQEAIWKSMAAKPGVMDAIRLWKLGKLKDDEFKEVMRFNGVDYEKDSQLWLDAVAQYPPYTDLIQFMVRDVEIDSLAEKRGYDEGFADRWKGKVKEWAEAQGITEEVMKKIWRAHWRSVGLEQMIVAMARLRNDKPGVQHVTTIDDVKEQLEIDDVPKFWRDRLIESAYRPLTRVDVRRAFEVDAIDREKVKSSYLDEVYNEDNAEALTKFAEVEKRRKQLRLGGAKPLSWYTQQYVSGKITRQELIQQIQIELKDQDVITRLIDEADFQREVKRRELTIKAIVKRYTLGDYDYAEARAELARCNIPLDLANNALDYCQIQDKLRSKQVPAATLCRWRSAGLISQADHHARLVRIGYDFEEANLIATMCTIDIQNRMGEALKKELMRQKREAEKAMKELQKSQCKPKKQCPEGQE